jgi:hypothetical protein
MSTINSNVLKTTQIQHTGGSIGINVDSAGRIFYPNRPHFWVYSNASSSGSAVGAFTTQFNTTVVNVGGHYNTSTGRFTAPVAGTYWFGGKILQRGVGVAEITLYKNGVNVIGRSLAYTNGGGTGGHHGDMNLSYYLSMAANDYCQFGVSTVAGAGSDYYYGEGLAHFMGHLFA